ncbi:MAG: hypothetical protein K6F09_00190 [Clostridiales bacterium]|nr:hypothetical protein [Clostridiales bacterium]
MKKHLTTIRPGLLFFYVHFVTEILCFFLLGKYTGDGVLMWLIPLTYDMLAFVPQSLIGKLSDKFPRLPLGVVGLLLMAGALGLFPVLHNPFISLVILCIGNGCTHIAGAEATLRFSDGKLSPAAIFVSGGSFGVITGKLLSRTALPLWVLILLAATAVPFSLLGREYRLDADKKSEHPCAPFCYHDPKLPPVVIVILSVLIVAVRGYMGYGIPTSWNKTTVQTVLLFVTMGVGKALGGILADFFGVRRTALLSAALALPFLLFGDRRMLVSLVGVMLFSMTMSITLALLVSVLPDSPGLAFGLTTIGLFIGTAPIFFFKFTTVKANCTVIVILTAVCLAAMHLILRRDRSHV